jgi:DNA ligase (NAD+)
MRKNIETVKEMVARLREADTAYYKHDNPTMTDREYDRLYDELAKLEAETGIILSGSPTQKVSGEILEGLTPVRHTKPMLSAGKTKSEAEIVKFIGGKAAVILWKLDGLTLVLRYENGCFKQAITRGEDGTIGEDVTHTARVFMNIPLEIPNTNKFEVRGEAVISWENFGRINRELEEPYSHPRNLASGSTRRLDASKSREQFLEFFAFELVSDDAAIVSKQGQFEKLKTNGFDTVFYLPIGEASDSGRIHAAIASFDPAKFDYPVDGLIVEYDDLAYGKSLGATGHHEKRLIALKWEDETYETTFLGLELATTRTGMVSITGKFSDTIIDGATVNRAYLHNLDILDSFSLGIGDRVRI